MLDMKRPFIACTIAVLTISDTRNLDNDKSGDILVANLTQAGHILGARAIAKDTITEIKSIITNWIDSAKIDVIITTGGTGLTGRDLTPEALMQLGGKEIIGFGELFRQKSYQKIGSSSIQSRALAVLVDGCYIFALPGSPSACQDGWDWILSTQLDNRHRPCNFIELMPRLKEI